MELASQIFLSLNFEIEKLFDPFLISYIPLRKMGSTASSLFGLIFWNLAARVPFPLCSSPRSLYFLKQQSWKIEKNIK